MPKSPRGRPLKLGSFDSEVCDYITNLRKSGGVVNRRIVIAATKGIVMAKDRSLLSEYGGPIDLTKSWAVSLMNRLGLVRRKGTKGVKSLPKDFESLKSAFIDRVECFRKEHKIPDALVINWDQTGSNFVPVSDWTMEEEGSKQVPIAHMDDKRQMTVLLACSLAGDMLPPQLLYQGKTDQCHPTFKFPEDWDVHHTESHWSTSETMQRYVEKVIVPYVEQIKENHDLPVRQRAICVFDVYKAHRGDKLRALLEKNYIKCAYVPAACTDQLQPLDILPNGVFKRTMKQCFEDRYADETATQIRKGVAISDIKIDLRLSIVKPLHANWLLKSVDKLRNSEDLIKTAWSKCGIQPSN
ncbi:hypothetical protein FSP39_016716 [Pinctada imbricata]|uniref:DDE-1 domain-containing protein n=1 Tax=Pinctada imbricata TaxID=66713 RepID=A0AA88XKJ7_PINIB|nr:hypothetical protein FSP39_016716 [Pinctada imbricata]